MKKFLAMVMALCMVCMTVVVASAAEPTSSVEGIRGATVDGDGRHVSRTTLTDDQMNALRTKANVGSYDQVLYGNLLGVEVPTEATIHLTTTPSRLRDTKVFYLEDGQWTEATCSRSGNNVTAKFPAGFSGTFSIVQYCNAPSSGASTGAEVKAPQTNDVSVELMLAAGMILFGTIAVVAKKRHAA